MNSYSRRHKNKTSKHRLILAIFVVLAVTSGIVYWLINNYAKQPAVREPIAQPTTQVVEPEPEQPVYEPIDLQPTVNSWIAGQAATYSIVVYDPQAKKVIGSNLPDQEYFAASLYKLFVAYLALMDFQSSQQNPDGIIISGHTRKQCVDKMIRESHSPCGEAMMADMGTASLETRVKNLGINSTTFTKISTTAQDCALILQYILEKKHLNDANTEFLLDAMSIQDQRFRNGLAKGAPEATWSTKVGWNEQYNYNDVGIMSLPDERKFVVAILSQGNGRSAPIADFAATIYAALKQ